MTQILERFTPARNDYPLLTDLKQLQSPVFQEVLCSLFGKESHLILPLVEGKILLRT